VRAEDFNAVEPAGNSARALAANVSTLFDEELLTGVEARPGSGIVVRREMADDAPQEGSCRDRGRTRARTLRGSLSVRQCRATAVTTTAERVAQTTMVTEIRLLFTARA
jgi:hypothetical protein